MPSTVSTNLAHSQAWVAQTWISFSVSISAMLLGLGYLEVDVWPRAFLAVAFLMSLSSTAALSKTLRDRHESGRLTSRVDDAFVEQLITTHNPHGI